MDKTESRFITDTFSYDPETGVVSTRVRLNNRWPAGRAVGYVDNHGYLRMRIQGRHYLVHRVAYFLQHGVWPAIVDHANGNRLDNRAINLRAADRARNAQNARSNKVLPKGVSTNGKGYRSRIRVNGKSIVLGTFSTPEEAHAAYRRAADSNFGEFSNYG